MRKIAVTGAFGSGKSTLCQILKELGADVVDADSIGHRLLKEQDREAVIELLGPGIVTGDQIDRHKVTEIVFNNPKKLKALEQILHPHIIEHIKQASAHSNLFVAEIPLLFEAGWENWFDTTVCVTRDQSITHPEYAKRMANQFPQNIKAEKSDIVIKNDGSLEQLQTKAIQLYKEISPHV